MHQPVHHRPRRHVLVLDDDQLAYLRWVLREVHHSRAFYREPLDGDRPLAVGDLHEGVLADAEQLMIAHGVPPLQVSPRQWPLEGHLALKEQVA